MNGVYYVNDDRQEYCSLPDPTSSQQLGMVGYLLVQGPFDGTQFSSYPSLDELEDEIEEWKARERRSEGETFQRYAREAPDYIISKFEREYGVKPSLDSDDFYEFCAEQAQSVYRDGDGEWIDRKMKSSVGADLTFDEYFDYFGRWAGDAIRIVVDEEEISHAEPITDDVVHEMHQTLPDQFLVDGETVLTPDMVVTTSDDDDGGDGGEEPDQSGSESGEKTLFPME